MNIQRDAITIKTLTQSVFELLDCVEAQLFWMIKYARENNLPIERSNSLKHLIARTRAILQELADFEQIMQKTKAFALSDDFLQRDESDEDFTEP